MTSNVSAGGGTAVFYLPYGGGRLGVLNTSRQTFEVMTIAHGKKVRYEIPVSDIVEAADPAGTTWKRQDIAF